MSVVTIKRLQVQQLAGRIRQPAPTAFRQHKVYSRADVARAITCAAARGEPPKMANGDEKVVQSFPGSDVFAQRNNKVSDASRRITGLDARYARWESC
jgi:hypothetical protein